MALEILTNRDELAQLDSFQNATLQGSETCTYSIAVHAEIPDGQPPEAYLEALFRDFAAKTGVEVLIWMGPSAYAIAMDPPPGGKWITCRVCGRWEERLEVFDCEQGDETFPECDLCGNGEVTADV